MVVLAKDIFLRGDIIRGEKLEKRFAYRRSAGRGERRGFRRGPDRFQVQVGTSFVEKLEVEIRDGFAAEEDFEVAVVGELAERGRFDAHRFREREEFRERFARDGY